MGEWPRSRTSSFHYNRCSICLLDVEQEQSLPDNSFLVPFHPSHAKPSNTSHNWCLTLDQFGDNEGEFYSYRDGHYAFNSLHERSILFHRRCLEFVQPLSWSQLHILSDVIEPTLLPSHKGKYHYSRHGAFSSAELSPLQRAFRIRDFLDHLPAELQDIVLGHGVERLIFVTKAASQLASWTRSFKPTKDRFTQKLVRLRSDTVRLHFIDLGGRVYIQDVSDPGDQMREPKPNETSRDYPLGRRDYLAVKTDGIGVIDIAFCAVDNHPQWIFHRHPNWESHPTISVIRDSRIRHLRLIRDVSQ